MPLLLMLVGCGPRFYTEAGPEPIRGAVWFDPLQVAGDPDEAGGAPRQRLVVLTNSPLPCAPAELENDPDTPTVDEAAAAILYWEGQVHSALNREGALAVGLGLYTWEDDFSGEYAVRADASTNAEAWLVEATHVAAGAWYRVDEAAVEEVDGIFYTYLPVELSYDVAVAEPAWVRVDEDDGTTLRGEFSFEPTELSGRFVADRCENASLYQGILSALVALRYADG